MPSPTADDLTRGLRNVLDAVGEPSADLALRRLSGGASRETWWVDREGADPLVLQRERTPRPRLAGGMASEGAVVTAAGRAGVPVPRIVADNSVLDDTALGASFLVAEVVGGETIARKILRDDEYTIARDRITADAGAALARLHAVDPSGLPAHIRPTDELAHYRAVVDELGLVSPAFELAFRWLERHRPTDRPHTLVHGDFRLGNLIVDDSGLAAVIDWELAHVSDPMEDLGWLCVRAWRFGGAGPVAGVGERETLWAAYEAAGGAPVDPAVARWWEVLGHLKWGVMCGLQLSAHTTGVVRSVELAAIGRRIAEQEYDLVRLVGSAP